jgi:hypothetical protein
VHAPRQPPRLPLSAPSTAAPVFLQQIPTAKEVEQFGRSHRLGLVLSVVAVLAGTGITAVAVAPFAPDAALLPQRLVTETLQPPDLQPQLDALALLDTPLTRNEVTRATDTAESLLARLGVRDPGAALFLRTDYQARKLLTGRGGKMIQARTAVDGSLIDLVARFPAESAEQAATHFSRVTVMRSEGGRLVAMASQARYGAQTRLASGTIRNTLFAATDESGVPDAVAAQLADLFSTDIDFHRELRKGDTFSIVYESLTADGEPVLWNEGAGRVLAAEFVNNGKAHHAVWFAQNEARGACCGR